ncbi:MAG: AcrR family transcriptional regulator [Alteromonadaceae bacterium]|jgi:AcrR family transcriptional regulator
MTDKPTNIIKKNRYHHGDLRTSLLTAATKMVSEAGIESLSLRKLAEHVGVSRTAAYHHFNDKNDLLCSVATQGFIQWQQECESIFTKNDISDVNKYRRFVNGYIRFAINNPSLYELMFGRVIWKDNKSTQTLRSVAYPSFNYQVKMTKLWQEKGLMPPGENTLRLAQVTWGTLHGLARLIIDGIYGDAEHIDDMCECIVNIFMAHQKNQ